MLYKSNLCHGRETQLSKRVADWTSRLEPILRAQEIAPEYDIHTYSDLVLTQIDNVSTMDLQRRFSYLGLLNDENTNDFENIKLNEKRKSVEMDTALVDFAEILDLDSNTSGEVCRIFLACLMLANTGNLDLVPPSRKVVTKKCMEKTNKEKNNENINKNINKNDNDIEKNDKKVDCIVKDNLIDEKRSFSVRLLNNVRHCAIEDFRAPSVSI